VNNYISRLRLKIWLALSIRLGKFFSKLPGSKRNQIELNSKQKDFFEVLGINYAEAKEKLNLLCLKLFKVEYNSANGMWSDHLIYFTGLSLSGFKPRNILEIGTFKGETTRILSELFPDCSIRTLDISKKEMQSKNIYAYALNSKIDIFEHRKRNIVGVSNIVFNELNSLFLTLETGEYDLIWLDGAHGYPIASMDFTNCIRMLSKEGKLVCDDVYFKIWKEDPNYFSKAVIDSLQAFAQVKIIDYKMILKRTDLDNNFWKNQTKYVAIAEKCRESN
jgi:predicted O-methyltransferase YrrM